MPFDGNGTFTPPSPEYPAVAGAVIYADDWNTIVADIAAGLSICITTDGQAVVSANIPMNNHKFTGLSAGSAAGDSTTYGQVFNGAAFTSPTITANPAVTDDSLLIPSTSWVMDFTEAGLEYSYDPPDTNYGRDLVTSKWVKDQVLAPVYVAGLAVYSFQTL